MSETAIEWAHPPGFDGETWNPTLGCSKKSPGCKGCYAIRVARRLAGNPNPKVSSAFEGLVIQTGAGLNWTGRVNAIEERLEIPLRKRRPTCYFVNSLSDLFHDEVSDEFIDRVFAVMAVRPQHRFIILTKSEDRMLLHFTSGGGREALGGVQQQMAALGHEILAEHLKWPLRNVHLGVSVENQEWANRRIPKLLATPAATRIVSYEPALGPINFRKIFDATRGKNWDCLAGDGSLLDQIIMGGESGPGARPIHPDWSRNTRDQCQATGTAFFFKQWGSYVPWDLNQKPMEDPGRRYVFADGRVLKFGDTNGGLDKRGSAIMQLTAKKQAGAMLDGREWREFPKERT